MPPSLRFCHIDGDAGALEGHAAEVVRGAQRAPGCRGYSPCQITLPVLSM